MLMHFNVSFVDPNIDTSSLPSSSQVFCYSNDMCTEGEDDQGDVLDFNDCCGEVVSAPYYRLIVSIDS